MGIGYSGAQMSIPVERVLEAERLGFDSVWTAEAYGSDAVTPLAYLAAVTEKIKLGTSIMQVAGRTPAMCAMTMATLDAISNGRALCGLGLSGPQVVEGWHGQPFGKPAAKLREYAEIIRLIWAREEPVSYEGKEYQLPYEGPGSWHLGKPLKSILHTRQVPLYLATMGPINIAMTAEIADGWLPIWFSPQQMHHYRPSLEKGLKKAGKSGKDFDIVAGGNVIITNDVKAGLAQMKPNLALYMGGMGAREVNFHNATAKKYGYGDAAEKIQELYLAGRKREATEAVPDELCDEMGLVGPKERIKERFKDWEDAGVTTLSLGSRDLEVLEFMADLTGANRGSAADHAR